MPAPELPRAVDAIVVGAGPNGLVAANRLADEGWEVLLVEAQPDVGGAVRSDREVHPDFVTDTFSAFYPMAFASPVMRGLDLGSYGLRWEHAPAVLGHPRPDGSWALLHRDPEVTAGLLDAAHPGDGAAWLALCARWRAIEPALLDALFTPFPPVRAAVRALGDLPAAGGLRFVAELCAPVERLPGKVFGGDAARLIYGGNACHADIPLTRVGSGLMGMILTMVGQTAGFPVPRGGAGELSQALARRFVARGGTVVTGARVDRIAVSGGRAVGVDISGVRVVARRAVLADVGAEQLYGSLVGADRLPASLLRRMRRFRRDPATVKVDWALDAPVPWASTPPYAPGTVHLADSYPQMVTHADRLNAGTESPDPFLLCGQMTTADASRSPAGTESFWAYTHVPQGAPVDPERRADQLQATIERYAPGFGTHVIARRVLTPAELERRDANLVGGSINGGTSLPRQQLVLRPVPGLGRAETPVRGLFLASASAHPGGSVHGACGMNAARAALARHRHRHRR